MVLPSRPVPIIPQLAVVSWENCWRLCIIQGVVRRLLEGSIRVKGICRAQ